MKRKVMLLWLLAVLCTPVFAQILPAVKGTVKDKSGAGIAGASVYLLNTNFKTSADDKGEFTFSKVPAGKYEITVNAIGYAALTQTITIGSSSTSFDLQLATAESQLGEVVVSAQKRDEAVQRVPISISTLSAKQVDD